MFAAREHKKHPELLDNRKRTTGPRGSSAFSENTIQTKCMIHPSRRKHAAAELKPENPRKQETTTDTYKHISKEAVPDAALGRWDLAQRLSAATQLQCRGELGLHE